jgi:pseudaminic acid synthase
MTFNKNFKIANFEVSTTSKPLVIAEISANHNGSIDKAKQLIQAAKDAGADGVKLQTYTPDTMTIDSKGKDFSISGGLWDGYSLYDLYKEAHTPYEWHQDLFSYANNIDLLCFSSPFDESAVDLLEELNCPAYKIASFEVTDIPLIQYVAEKNKPMIISTGMASEGEIEECLEAVKDAGTSDVILLHCVSGYPTPFDQYNINTIKLLAERFDIAVGLSDHTLGTEVSVAAVGFGIKLIEKHFTLSRDDHGPDSVFSLEPSEFKKLTTEVYNAWESLGEASFNTKSVEEKNLSFRRSIYVVEDIAKGEILTNQNIKRIRPGFGLHPKYFHQAVGKSASKELKRGDRLLINDFE